MAASRNPAWLYNVNDVSGIVLPKGTLEPAKRFAVSVESGVKRYGKTEILKNLNMHVEEGTIYAMLGSSGCGKTTLLSCIVGLRQLDSGTISVCGRAPGSKGSGVPGKLIGYMPQEVALNGEFTIREACHYFGRLYGMDGVKVDERVKHLVTLLHLGKCHGLLKHFSGGERRRVSFAVSLIHEPEILILDEPTVGVDPLLRQAIWEHLGDVVKQNRTTVIITTHYIEETQNAHNIGLMRNGRLILEDSPLELLKRFECKLLEEVVLRFCLKDEGTENQRKLKSATNQESRRSVLSRLGSAKNHERFKPEDEEGSIQGVEVGQNSNAAGRWNTDTDYSTKSFQRLQAMYIKNLFVLFRSIGYLLFLFILPAAQIVMICVCLSSDPKSLNFGVVNHEVPVNCSYEEGLCMIANFSCGYLQALKSDTIKLIPYDAENTALEAVQNGELVGYLSIPQNFTDALFERVMSVGSVGLDNITIQNSQVSFALDMSNSQVALILQRLFLTRFRDFMRSLMESCGQNPDGKDIPLLFLPPVYGQDGGKITNFVTPGVTTAFLSFLSSLTCGLAFIGEKKDGMVHRTIVAGVKKLEIMLAHLGTQFLVLLAQTSIAFLAMFLLFNIPHLGSIPLAFVLVTLNGVAGMSLGFLAATYCNEEKHAMMLAIGTILPCFLLSGAIFPSEALPLSLQYIGYLLPGTLPGEALRAILLKGWGMSHYIVWIGFVSAAAWIIIYWTLTGIHHLIWD